MVHALDGFNYFPPEFVNPRDKEDNDYGLQYAKAMYNCEGRFGGRRFNGTDDCDYLVTLAQGRQSTDDLRRAFGYHTPQNAIENKSDVTADLAWINPQVLNLAPKYINRVVAKMQKFNYDVGLEAIDLSSLDEKGDYLASIQAFYTLREWMKQMNYNPQVLFPDLDISSLPIYPDEMMYDIMTNPKLKKEISGELLMKLISEMNDLKQTMRSADWNLATLGWAHLHCYADENGNPRIDQVNHKYWLGSYVEDNNFEQQEYAGFYDFITVNQFIKETSKELTQEQQMEIVSAWTNRSTHSFIDYRRLENYDGLGYIPVMRFYFRSQDNRNFIKKNNGFNRTLLVEKSHNYRPPKDVLDKIDAKEYRLVPNEYTSVYGGTWIVDSDIVYNYKRQNYPRQNLVNASLPIKTFATNFKEGRPVSFLSQILEPLYMLNVTHNKIKQILAEGRMGVMEIDFNQIEEVAIGQGGQKWTPLDVMKFFFKKNILIKRGATTQYDQKLMDAITMNTGGLTLADYFEAFRTYIQILETMTSTSAIESTEVPDRLTAKNAELSQMTSDVDLEYLYNGHEFLHHKVCHQSLLIAQGSLQNGKTLQGYIPALGKVNTGFFKAPREIAYCEYGLFFTRQPTEQEWASFLQDVAISLEQQKISTADSAFLRDIQNLKQARQLLAVREQIYQRVTIQQKQSEMQMQAALLDQSAAKKLEGELAKIREKAMADQELEKLKGLIEMKKLEATQFNARMIATVENQVKRDVAKQVSTDEIIKQGVRNIPEKQKNQVDLAKVEADVAKLGVDREKIDVEREKVQVMKNKPAPKSK